MKLVLTVGDGGELCVVGDGQEYPILSRAREVGTVGMPSPGTVYNDLTAFTFTMLDMTYNQVDQTL